MLLKIDCVMVPVPVGALDEAAAFYARAFGLRRRWQDESAVGMTMPETDAEIVLHKMDLPPELNVYYLVDDVAAAVAAYRGAGCTVRTQPFDVPVGRCAVLEDPYGNAVCVLDLSKGLRPTID
jgi:predicted enzyme related to lactoylglutathione lyase